MLPSRKERRSLAKQFGLSKSKPSFKDWIDQTTRTIAAGQMIHHANLQRIHNESIEKNKSKKVE